MPTYSVTLAQSQGTLRFDADESLPSELVAPIRQWLESYSQNNTFASGETLQFGWYLFRFEADGGDLRLLAPTMQSMPIEWTSDVTAALRGFHIHRFVAESYGADVSPPHLAQYATVSDGYQTAPRVMWRDDPVADSDSGWFVASSAADRIGQPLEPTDARPISLFELAIECPDVLPYFALPTGFRIAFANDQFPRVWCDDAAIEAGEGSYEQRRAERRGHATR